MFANTIPRDMRLAPALDPSIETPAPTPRHALLINPFYPKDPHASFGKHVLTPSLALTSIAGGTPPEWTINGRPLGAAAIHLPDLSDPAYRGTVRPQRRDVHFQYNGWLRGQKTVPGSALRVGLNKIVIRLTKDSEPVAVRAVELQFKHHWQYLDYKLAP